MAQKLLPRGYVSVALGKLSKAKWNYKENDETLTAKLLNNMKRNGQIENIVVRELNGKYEIVNGNHRLDAFRKMKVESVVAFNLGKISKEEAQRIAVELNETRFESDPIAFARTISELTKAFSIEELAATLPFDDKQILNFKNLLEFDWGSVEEAQLYLPKRNVIVIYGSKYVQLNSILKLIATKKRLSEKRRRVEIDLDKEKLMIGG